jgi:hypothetical protein
MSTNIRLKSSSQAGKVPTLSDLALRELAVNTTDGKLYLRKGDGTGTDIIVDITAAAAGMDHGTLSGLVDDDHPQYLHATITRTGVTAEFNTTGKITTTNNVGIGTTNPTSKLHVVGAININNESQINTNNVIITSSTSQFVADTFLSSAYRTTKYLIQVSETGASEYYSSEILLMHDGTTVYLTEYGTLRTNNSPVSSIDADINSGNVRLLVTPAVLNTTTKISRISLTT